MFFFSSSLPISKFDVKLTIWQAMRHSAPKIVWFLCEVHVAERLHHIQEQLRRKREQLIAQKRAQWAHEPDSPVSPLSPGSPPSALSEEDSPASWEPFESNLYMLLIPSSITYFIWWDQSLNRWRLWAPLDNCKILNKQLFSINYLLRKKNHIKSNRPIQMLFTLLLPYAGLFWQKSVLFLLKCAVYFETWHSCLSMNRFIVQERTDQT